MSFQRFPIYKI